MARLKYLWSNPWIFGLTAGLFVILFSFAIGTLAEGSLQGGYADFVNNDGLFFLIPVTVALQMGLYMHYRNVVTKKIVFRAEKIGVAGSIFSSVTLVACCVACCVPLVWSVLPAIGLALAASSFVMEYRETLIILALLANLGGSALLLLAIRRHKR